jgi:hypothetical protein
MHEEIAEQQQRQCGEHRQVAPVLAGDDLARDDGEKQGRESQVEKRGGGCPDPGRE